jgi:succinyl-CoA synthetase alpha subunit
MAILVNKDTRLIVQGITGYQGRYHTEAMLKYGTKIVAGVTPGKEGLEVHGVPVYNSVENALKSVDANASIVFVPAQFARDAIFEAIDAGIKIIVIITERIPIHDAIQIMQYAKLHGVNIIGPNTPGIISVAERVKIGIMPSKIFKPGSVGVISRSGTLTYEIVDALTKYGFGQSTCIGLGGDRIIGLSFTDVLKLFEKDTETNYIVLVGEIGGSAEEEAAHYIKTHSVGKKICAYIAGRSAPKDRRMGHAGAIIARDIGSAGSKINAFRNANVPVARTPTEIAQLL